jgi:uncharacterized membrane protein YdbT with pleckstrin-like domain
MRQEMAAQNTTRTEELLFEGHPARLQSLGEFLICVLTLGIAFIYYTVRSKTVHYRITTQRVIVETGLFGKRMDHIDVYRIHDFIVDRPFLQRLLGTGNILLMTTDRTTPIMQLRGLGTDVMALYEKLRSATEEDKKARGVRIVEEESA